MVTSRAKRSRVLVKACADVSLGRLVDPFFTPLEALESRQLLSAVVAGSGLSTTITASAGDTLTFRYDLISSAKTAPGELQDFAYYTLNGNTYLVASQNQEVNPSTDIYSSGFQTGNASTATGYAGTDPYSLATTVPITTNGSNTFGIGITSVDGSGSSVLVLDDIELVHNGVSTVITTPGLQSGDFEPTAGTDFSGFNVAGAAALQFMGTLGNIPAFKNTQFAALSSQSGSAIDSATDATPDIYSLATNTGTTVASLQALADQINPVPSGPINLAPSVISSSEIDLKWLDTAATGTVNGYAVERQQGTTGTWGVVATLPNTATSYADTGLSASTQYIYRVRAFNTAGNSAFAGPQAATTLANLTAPKVTVSDAGGVYTGSAYPATGSVTGTGGVNLGSPKLTYYASTDTTHALPGAPSTVGNYVVVASYAGGGIYTSASASATFSITPAKPTVTVTDSSGTYSGSTFAAVATVKGVSGSAGSSLENVKPTLFYYIGTSASGTGSSTAPKSSGTYTVVATFPGSADYSTASASVQFTIAKAKLVVTAKNISKVYGATLPALSATITGLVTGDSSSVVTGLPSLSTTATATSAVGGYPITAAIGTLAAANYTFTFANGTLSVTAASTAIALTSSASNGSLPGQSVTFSAKVGVVAPGAGTLSGKVQFYVDGSAYGAAVTLGSSGILTTSDAALSPGSHNITAAFTSSNSNFNNSTAAPLTQSVGKFTATLSHLSAPTVSRNTSYVALGGTITGSNTAVKPTGTVTISSYFGGVQEWSRAVTIQSNGTFAGEFFTQGESAGQHTLVYSYSGDGNYNATSSSVTETITSTPAASCNFITDTTALVQALTNLLSQD